MVLRIESRSAGVAARAPEPGEGRPPLRRGQKLGKYRIERRLGEGGFSVVYQAYDTIEGVRVALKMPNRHPVEPEALKVFRSEVKVNARLDHPNILPVKYAGFIEDRFIVVYPLGRETLGDRLGRRLSTGKALDWAEQMLEAVAFAHRKRILHLDVKPDNLILFPGDRLRLADFGLARVSYRTMSASGSGTVGYLAPEQAMGRPSLRSDVFSLGLVLYRMFAGVLPRWPFEWPPPRFDRLRRKATPEMIELIRRALEVDHRYRYGDANHMLVAFRRAKPKVRRKMKRRPRRAGKPAGRPGWKELRSREFQRLYRGVLETRHRCSACKGPVSEPMRACPWCGAQRPAHRGPTRFPARCPRCGRGRKLDWRFCPWCYGGAFPDVSSREYTDTRYEGRCRECGSGRLMRFMKYCPTCNRKLGRPWPLNARAGRCPRCRWGVLKGFWEFCPWCARRL